MRGVKPFLKTDPEAITDLAAPAWLSEAARAEWERVMPILAGRKILTVADLGSLENYCCATGTVRECEAMLQAEGRVIETPTGPKRHPAGGIQADAMTRARLLAAELGLTPVSRSRPAIREDDDEDELI
ncbi:phage terminase small subunit P27 family [Cereibacter sphaeroides]|uniref:phage terminase small subunit P27 family n=1 Tax=Cereibacter sphaeroides TaxID=1063 RepID=UPI001F1BDE45|nr:phage terminase small subunit P27 family [Cereibacter sphaeroides]MCE6960572.1 phage terminase small subunit P27 family [Cereibacter sphaeroides]MCE6972747.1 phage terminase small subunit P27 family [Cereibacter sphaeroides]